MILSENKYFIKRCCIKSVKINHNFILSHHLGCIFYSFTPLGLHILFVHTTWVAIFILSHHLGCIFYSFTPLGLHILFVHTTWVAYFILSHHLGCNFYFFRNLCCTFTGVTTLMTSFIDRTVRSLIYR